MDGSNTSARSLLNELIDTGVELTEKEGRISCQAAEGVLNPRLRRLIAENEQDLLGLIRSGAGGPEPGLLDEMVAQRDRARTGAEAALRSLEPNNSDQASFETMSQDWSQSCETAVNALISRGFVLIKSALLNGETVVIMRNENVRLPARCTER